MISPAVFCPLTGFAGVCPVFWAHAVLFVCFAYFLLSELCVVPVYTAVLLL